MWTLKEPKLTQSRANELIRHYIYDHAFVESSTEGGRCAVADRRRSVTREVRNAAHAFLPKKKRTRVFYRYPHIERESREAQFATLMQQWLLETRFHSSLTKKFMHPSYQAIMAMGMEALPLILHELQKAPGHWFYALRFIVQRDIAESAVDFEEARMLWLNWGKRYRYIQ